MSGRIPAFATFGPLTGETAESPRPTTGGLLVIANQAGPAYYGKWRDSTGRQVKKRLGPAWLESDGADGWRKRRGRVPFDRLDERKAMVLLGEAIKAREEELATPTVAPADQPAFADAATAWLHHLEHVKGVKPSTLLDHRYDLAPAEAAPRKRGKPPAARIMKKFGHRPLASKGRALGVCDVLTDGLAGALEAARRDAGEHLLEHDPSQRVAVSEMRVGRQGHLAAAVGGPGPRALHADTPAAERDLAGLMPVAHGRPIGVALALRANNVVELGLHHLSQHTQADTHAQRQQPLLGGADQLAQRLLHTRRQRQLAAGDLLLLYGPHGGPLVSVDLSRNSPRSQRDRTRRGTATYKVLRATGQPLAEFLPVQVF